MSAQNYNIKVVVTCQPSADLPPEVQQGMADTVLDALLRSTRVFSGRFLVVSRASLMTDVGLGIAYLVIPESSLVQDNEVGIGNTVHIVQIFSGGSPFVKDTFMSNQLHADAQGTMRTDLADTAQQILEHARRYGTQY